MVFWIRSIGRRYVGRILEAADIQRSLDRAAIRATKGCRNAKSGGYAPCTPEDIANCEACRGLPGPQSFEFTRVTVPSLLLEDVIASLDDPSNGVQIV
jgi:hypothetical protein